MQGDILQLEEVARQSQPSSRLDQSPRLAFSGPTSPQIAIYNEDDLSPPVRRHRSHYPRPHRRVREQRRNSLTAPAMTTMLRR